MYNDVYVFPAIITNLDKDDYNITFPNFKEIVTYGDTLETAYIMAEDALKLCIFDLYEESKEIPEAINLNTLDLKHNQSLILVRVNLEEIIKEYDSRAIKKTLSVPSWLNKKAENAGLNFSQILQEALKERLNLK